MSNIETPSDTPTAARTLPHLSSLGHGGRLLAFWRRTPLSFKITGTIGMVLVFVFIRFTVDDAFISWRYALSLVRSGQWNYSASVPRVEGYTNFLYAALAVVPAALHIPIELFFKLVALALLTGYLWAVRRGGLGHLQTLALAVIVLCNPSFMIMLFSGLETVSFALLTALVFALVYRNGRLGRLGYLAACALSLSRPEGIVFAGVAMLWSLVVTRRRAQLAGLLVVGGAWSLYWVWRWNYFSYFWPSSYYVKSGSRGSASAQLVNALGGLIPTAIVAGLVLLVVALVPEISRRQLRDLLGRSQDATPAVLAATSAVVVLGLYHSSNLEMNFVNRFQWQLLFPVILVSLARPLAILGAAGGVKRHRDPAAGGPGPPVESGRTETIMVGLADGRTSSKLPSSAEVWALIALVLATVTSIADAPSRLAQISVTGAAVIVAVAVVLRVALGKPAATVLAALALASVFHAFG